MSHIASFADSYHNLISLLASIATISIAIWACIVNKKTFNNSLPYIYVYSKKVFHNPNLNETYHHASFIFNIDIKNDGKGNIFFGRVFLKDNTTKKVYSSKPINSLKKDEEIRVSISSYLGLKDKHLTKEELMDRFTYYIYFFDIHKRKYFIADYDWNDEFYVPNVSKKIHFFSLAKKVQYFLLKSNVKNNYNSFKSLHKSIDEQDDEHFIVLSKDNKIKLENNIKKINNS